MSVFPKISPWLRSQALRSGFADTAARRCKGIRMLMHHGIDKNYGRDALDEQVGWLKTRFPILPFQEVAERLKQQKKLPDLAVVLTFDDGLRNNITEAYPVLLKHQIPATFFICPGLINEKQWVWTYEVRERLQSLAAEQRRAVNTQCTGEASTTIDDIVAGMKKQTNDRRRQLLETIRAATPKFQATEEHRHQYDLASWEELQKLDQRLISIGSHTMSHPILSSLSDGEIEIELSTSKRALLDRDLARDEQVLLCYPDGNYDDRVLSVAQRHYYAACSTQKGFVKEESSQYALPRIGANSNLEDVVWRLWRPAA